ncbi:hypothetical protein VTN02DRAFT_6393 [Thermoascus thermophilus]
MDSPTGAVAGGRSTREPTVTYASVPATPLSPAASGHGITGTVPRVGLPLSPVCLGRPLTSVGHRHPHRKRR